MPREAVIPPEKLTGYLLLERPWDDKSKFLAQGEFLRVEGEIQGPNGRRLAVTTIRLRQESDGLVRFITLKPRREKR